MGLLQIKGDSLEKESAWKALGAAGLGLGGILGYNKLKDGDNFLGNLRTRNNPTIGLDMSTPATGGLPSIPEWATKRNPSYGGGQNPFGLPGVTTGAKAPANILQAHLLKKNRGIAETQAMMDKMQSNSKTDSQRALLGESPTYQALQAKLSEQFGDKTKYRQGVLGEYNNAMGALTGELGSANHNVAQLSKTQKNYDDWVRRFGVNTELGKATFTGKNNYFNTIMNKFFGVRRDSSEDAQKMIEAYSKRQRDLAARQNDVAQAATPIF